MQYLSVYFNLFAFSGAMRFEQQVRPLSEEMQERQQISDLPEGAAPSGKENGDFTREVMAEALGQYYVAEQVKITVHNNANSDHQQVVKQKNNDEIANSDMRTFKIAGKKSFSFDESQLVQTGNDIDGNDISLEKGRTNLVQGLHLLSFCFLQF